jgi:class 3 adenylate cyclase
MTCPSCGAPSGAGAKFCQECGAKLPLGCPGCGTIVAADQKFCAECGRRLFPAPVPASPPAPAAGQPLPAAPRADLRSQTPSGYTPPHLAERILKDRAALEGERKQVTILFADVSGFTSLAEALDPEDVHALMSRAFELMLSEIHRYEGTVNQFLGDGLMALFGAPVAHEDHARRAALAALGIGRALAGYREELGRARGIDFRMRMGLNTGLVVVGAIGDNLRMDYTAVGDTTNVAARMQQIAEPGQIVASHATRRLIEPYFELRPLGAVSLKNRAEPVHAWALSPALPRAAARRALAPLLGRAEPLAVLERAAAQARAGRGQAVYVVGEPGIGKSRLLRELRDRLGDAVSWIEGRCLSYGQSTAFLPLTEALRNVFGVVETDSEGQVVSKITAALEPLGERGQALAPYLRFGLALDPGDPAVAAMDPSERLNRLLRGITMLVRLRSAQRPTVLVIEDLHWIDAPSEQYLASVIDGLPGMSALLILTWRPTYRAPFGEHTYVSRIVLEPLEEDDALALVRATLDIEDLPGELARLISRKAEGNPFFLEEIGRALLETGAVRAEAGRLAVARPAASLVVPDRVQDVIAARIDRLTEEQKRTVHVASVIGREFPLRLLRRVVNGAARVEDALAQLTALEFVSERAAPEDPEYVFRHALTQDVAYESILRGRRRELHARIAAAIEQLYADRLDERVEELAYHSTRGEVWDKAARHARQAGDRAAALCVDAKATEFYEQALAALARLPEDGGTAGQAIDLRLAMRVPLWRSGQLDRLFEVYKDAEALAQRHGQTERLDAVYAFFAQYHWAKGNQSEAVAYGQRCLEVAEARGDLALRVTARYYLAWSYYVTGRFQAMLEQVDRGLELLDGPRALERFGLSGLPYSGLCAHAALALLELGDLPRALSYLERGERVAEAAQHLYSTVPIGLARGLVLLETGQVAEAVETFERMVAVSRERRFVGQLMLALAGVSRAYTRSGRFDEAIAAAREAIRVKDQARAPVTRGHHVLALAEACLGAGRLEEAEAAAREAREWSVRLGERPWTAWAEWTLGEIAARRGDRAVAAGHFEAGLVIAQEFGMRPLAGRCEASLARPS